MAEKKKSKFMHVTPKSSASEILRKLKVPKRIIKSIDRFIKEWNRKKAQ